MNDDKKKSEDLLERLKGGSVFSFLKAVDGPAGGVPPPRPEPLPPPESARQPQAVLELKNKLAELEAKIKSFEAGAAGLASVQGGVPEFLRGLESRLAALESRPAATPKIGAPAPGLEAKLKQMLGNAESGIRSLLEEYRRSGEEKSAKISQLVTELGQAVEHNRRVSSGGAAELDRRLKAVEVEGGTLEQIAAALEHAVSDLKKQVGEGAAQTFAPLRKELEAQKSRVGAIEELMRHPDVSALNSVSLSVSLLEGRLKNLESGLANELKERFSILDSAFGDVSRKAGLTQETAAGSARRVEKLEEQAARLPYLENRLNSGEAKLGKIYELEALGQSLRVSVEGMEKNFSAAMRESAFISSEHKKTCSDLESLSQQVKHLAALFNQLRTELAFLMPRRQESPGG